MLLSSELIIKPQKSQIYLRVVSVLYLLTGALVVYASINLLIQFILLLVLGCCFQVELKNKSPCPGILELRVTHNQCTLMLTNKQTLSYEKVEVLLHNELFQLIKLYSTTKNKLLVLFNDQLPLAHLKLLHVKTNIKKH